MKQPHRYKIEIQTTQKKAMLVQHMPKRKNEDTTLHNGEPAGWTS
jgi:hypothetical protein